MNPPIKQGRYLERILPLADASCRALSSATSFLEELGANEGAPLAIGASARGFLWAWRRGRDDMAPFPYKCPTIQTNPRGSTYHKAHAVLSNPFLEGSGVIEKAEAFLARGQGRQAAVGDVAAVRVRGLDVANLNAVAGIEGRKPCKGACKDDENRLWDSRRKHLVSKPGYATLF